MFLVAAIVINIFACLVQGDEVAEETSDTIALLKCEIEELRRGYNDVKEENKLFKEKLDEIEKVKIDKIIQENTRQDVSIEELRRGSSILSSHCRLLPTDVCGNCTCIDDYRSDRKYFCDCQRLTSKRDCLEHFQDGNHISGVYRIHANHMKEMQVYCDQETDNGGWTVFQRRVDGSTNFYRNWKSYKEGFGASQWNLWLGLENIYILTVQSIYPKGSELRIDMQHWKEGHLYTKYNHFSIDDEKHEYTMHISGFSGNTGDQMSYHNGLPFATYDRSTGEWKTCPTTVRGAWWYGKCSTADLNAEYVLRDDSMPAKWRGMSWGGWKDVAQFKYADMKIRRLT